MVEEICVHEQKHPVRQSSANISSYLARFGCADTLGSIGRIRFCPIANYLYPLYLAFNKGMDNHGADFFGPSRILLTPTEEFQTAEILVP